MDRTFAPARDRSAAALWALVGVSALTLLAVAWWPFEETLPWPLAVLFSLLALGLVGLTFAAPRRLRYTLTAQELRVRHLSGVSTFPVRGLHVRRATGRLGLKLGGTGLPGYYTGNYGWRGEGPKHVQALASSAGGGVLLEFGGSSSFLTPAEVSAFLIELEARGAVVER